ncbi:5295_t:CDS:1, partial [Gigaspora margarita]
IQALKFLGAFSEPFEAKFRVNIYTADKIKAWLEEFSDLHKITMRETQGRVIKGVKYLYSKWFHCAHSNIVKLKQGRKVKKDHENTNPTKNEKSEIINTRKWNTECPAILSIQLRNIFDTYPCIISLQFHYNYPLTSSHAMSFRPICNETKDAFFNLFNAGHGPTSAYHTYMEEIQLKYDNDEEVLADRAICPQKYDIYYLHKKFLDQSVGAKNGKEMFSRLAKEVEEFNTNEKGCAWMQPYIAPTSIEPGQPLVLVVITNLMKRCHSLQQAGELVYMDTTASLDAFNTPLTLLSASTPIGSLPLAAILTSDETAFTFTEALNILKRIMPLEAFNGRGILGPEVIMTDDCKAERMALHNVWDKTTLLLCVFYFLQAMWRWLWDGKHGINMNDRVILIEHMKKIVFARTESKLEEEHTKFTTNQ